MFLGPRLLSVSCMFFCFFMYNDLFLFFFFFNDTATTEIYTLSLHDALPIFLRAAPRSLGRGRQKEAEEMNQTTVLRSEEHTSELQSQSNLVCRLLLEKKKNKNNKKLASQTENDRHESLHTCYDVDTQHRELV